jgi:TP53 regulating kinase-like protein
MEKGLIGDGAEAKVYLENSNVIKERIQKKYRNPELDEQIRKRRNKAEAKILERATEKNLNSPKLIKADKFTLTMEFLNGEKLSSTLNEKPKEEQLQIIKMLAKEVKKMHRSGISHGDLTTSNVILKDNKIYIIDFGLGKIHGKTEDKAVDLHVLREAINAKHFENYEDLWKTFLETYEDKEVLERLIAVEKRGRYKH